jgi:hypothetical protein
MGLSVRLRQGRDGDEGGKGDGADAVLHGVSSWGIAVLITAFT